MKVQIKNVRDAEIIHDMLSGLWDVNDNFRAFEQGAEVLVEEVCMDVLPREMDAMRLQSPRGMFTYIVLGCLFAPLRIAEGGCVIDTAVIYVHSESDETNIDWMLREGRDK